MRLRQFAGILLLATTLGAGVPAAHAQYPPVVGNARVTRSELKQCQCTQFSGDGFEPGSTVTVYDRNAAGVERVVGTAKANHKGEFKLKVCFDQNSAEGQHTLIGRGVQPDGRAREVRANVRVEGTVCYTKDDEIHGPNVGGSGSDRGGGLPGTGAAYVLPSLLLGFLLVAVGTGVVHLTRRRRLATG